MAFKRGLMPTLLDQEGLFARKSSSNILSDPRILEHLRNVAQEAQIEDADEEYESDDSDNELEKRELYEKVRAYNSRSQVGAFGITQHELDYRGAVRFYFEAGEEKLTKAVLITNKTNVKELLPILIEKFNLSKDIRQCVLFVVHENDEIALDNSDCPLEIAINALNVPRFVLRFRNKENTIRDDSNSLVASAKQRSTDQSSYSEASDIEFSLTHQTNQRKQEHKIDTTSHVSSISGTEPSATTKKAKRAKSFTHLASMVRKRKGAEKAESTELSTYRLAPGILKVYGDHVSPGSNYKSVRASTISTAKEVVKQALEKYALGDANPSNFVLCDVVGHFKVDKSGKGEDDHEEAQWVTEYMRIVNDNEKPLVVQSLWKPAAGRLRRFELVKRVQLEAGCFFINTAENLREASNMSSPNIDSERSSIISDQATNESILADSQTSNAKSISEYLSLQESQTVIHNMPHLLLIKGYSAASDHLVYPLMKPNITIGKLQLVSVPNSPDICLDAPDIAQIHCYIHKKIAQGRGTYDTNIDEVSVSVFIEPVGHSHIDINGVTIKQSTLLIPGQLVSIGTEYCFIFKDPSQAEEKTLKLTWLDSLKQNISQKKLPEKINFSVQADFGGRQSDETDYGSTTEILTTTVNHDLQKCEVKRSPAMLTYEYDDEDGLLDKIIRTLEQRIFKLMPAYLLTMMIEHSCATFNEVHARKLLLKISSALQSIAWERTKDIGRTEKKSNVVELFDEMLRDLAPVVMWMANSLEMLHYLQCNLNGLLQAVSPTQAAVRESLVLADEELLTVLEEVIMFTFQQTVYHLTKVLYSSLPAILDSNPFQNEEGDDDEETMSTPPGVSFIINIYAKMLSLVQQHMVHPQIVKQLFEYLFFFTNASLFNSLMERGAGGKFYRWTKGVQIRGNLDVLEEFANRNGLQHQFSAHMKKVVAAIALLSIPKAQLMSMDWLTIREEFPDLNASQVQQLLGEYQLSGKMRPRGWYPPPEEVEAALRTSDVLESFATHPPLLLPTTDFQLNLINPPEDEEFLKCLLEFNGSLGNSKDELLEASRVEKRVSANTMDSKRTKISNSSDDNPPIIGKENNFKDVEKVKSLDKNNSSAGDRQPNQVSHAKGDTDGISKSSMVFAESKAKQEKNNPNTQNTKDNGISDVDFTSNDKESTTGSDGVSDSNDVILIDLVRGDKGLGLGLIDGLITPLASPGIYIRTVVANSPAAKDGRINLGDRILAVNGNSLIGCDYSRAMDMIINAGSELSFLIARSDRMTIEKILSSQC